ncbi:MULTISPECIES: LysR substrate-binding domain-containing protein [Paracoccus]|uniref:LysR family transcriptional regulator n=1 Tax=Paracoccus litorisediminis TaxID=2006130 RepID=A0A844HPQ7_9RHOB|nr:MULTISPECIES: LysR substrate-binding domain-containing protein [Paracoccus]MBD9527701.1 LysR family transcriptional regulator [Paracoccus sp. PAR01]MTH60337.1 LysR family transcriptional regulator [Paracoccus litorisediminis]
MELKRLTYFLAVAEELHFGRAAARLDMAQPPLSRQIAALETELGVLLFDRSRSQIRLTQAGEVFRDHARHILERLDTACRDTRAIGLGGAGRLRIAFVGSASHGLLPTLIKSFRSHYPEVELALSAMNNAELHRALVSREIDVAVARPALQDDEFRSELLCREKLILALPDNSPLAGQSRITFADLADQTFVLYPRRPRPSYADVVLGICQREGFTPAKLELTQDFQSAISLVSVGVGLSVVPESVARTQRPGVVYRPYEGDNPGTALTIHARLDNRAPQVVNFLEITRKFARSTLTPPAASDRP